MGFFSAFSIGVMVAKDPAFLFYPGDYLRDTQCFSEKTQVSYDRIMCEHMRNICISKQQVKFFTKRLNDEETEELMTCLVSVNGGYQINWVAESIEKRRAYSDSRRKNKEGKKKNICKSYDNHMENENEDINKDVVKDVKIKYAENVFLTEKEYSQILTKHFKGSKEWMDRAIEKLDAYKLSGDNTYKSDAGAIRSWVVKEMKKEALEENKNKPENKHAGIDEWLILKTKEMEDAENRP